jgi:hypothetical protein
LNYFVFALEKKGIEYCLTGIQYCLDNKIPFLIDSFSKNPLDYAKETKNRKLIDKIYFYINQ